MSRPIRSRTAGLVAAVALFGAGRRRALRLLPRHRKQSPLRAVRPATPTRYCRAGTSA